MTPAIHRLAVGASVAGLIVVAVGCGEPQPSISSNGLTALVVFDRDFQLEKTLPIVEAVARCNLGPAIWRHSVRYGFNLSSPATKTLAVDCASLGGVMVGTVTWEMHQS